MIVYVTDRANGPISSSIADLVQGRGCDLILEAVGHVRDGVVELMGMDVRPIVDGILRIPPDTSSIHQAAGQPKSGDCLENDQEV